MTPDLPPTIPDSEDDAAGELLPVRMLNEYVYCPRLFHFMHVDGIMEENQYVVEGKNAHRAIDALDQLLPDPRAPAPDDTPPADAGDEPPAIARSVPLGSPALGLSAKLDLVACDGDEAIPVETKRGRVPDTPEHSYEPERVQLMAQGLLLREHGYRCTQGILYFAASRRRVPIPFTPELEAATRHYLELARIAAQAPVLPPPLHDSPKCWGCSLAGICLPDETHALQQVPPDPAAPAVRRFYPARDEALPLYVQEQGAKVGKDAESLTVTKSGETLTRVGLKDLSQLVLCGNVGVSAQALHLLCEAAIPVVHLSTGHWFYGLTHGFTLRNAYARAAQYPLAADPHRCLPFAAELVAAKGQNQRTMLRRNGHPPDTVLDDMSRLLDRAPQAPDLPSLLGLEGTLARHYFQHFATMLKDSQLGADWDFQGRNRRPPRDPLNALLSFGYALLAKECTLALLAEGLDPWWGFYHQPRHGRPALALDLMEPLRPLIVDSAVITAVNTAMLTPPDFTRTKAGCTLKPNGRKAFLRAYEARLDHLITHPLFDYRCSWRTVIRLQARLLARWLRGDLPAYQSLTTR